VWFKEEEEEEEDDDDNGVIKKKYEEIKSNTSKTFCSKAIRKEKGGEESKNEVMETFGLSRGTYSGASY
jgi:hypothetical protein